MVTVRFYAGARAAAGVPTARVSAASVDELVSVLAGQFGQRLAVVLPAASFLVDGTVCHDQQAALPAGSTVDVLPPFAGG